MNTLETAARDYARIKPDVFIDSEERYYNGHACENYDTFKAGANWAFDTIFKLVGREYGYTKDCYEGYTW